MFYLVAGGGHTQYGDVRTAHGGAVAPLDYAEREVFSMGLLVNLWRFHAPVIWCADVLDSALQWLDGTNGGVCSGHDGLHRCVHLAI